MLSARWPARSSNRAPQALEAQLQAALGQTEDHRAAVEAFLAKRPPSFAGR